MRKLRGNALEELSDSIGIQVLDWTSETGVDEDLEDNPDFLIDLIMERLPQCTAFSIEPKLIIPEDCPPPVWHRLSPDFAQI